MEPSSPFIGTEHISSVAMPVSMYEGGNFVGIRLCSATAQDPMKKFG